MQCRDVREMADSFLSEELLIETDHEMLRHLDLCPACSADVATRRALRASLRRAFLDVRDLDPSPEFVAQLRTRLRASALRNPARRVPMFLGWWALAATVFMVVSLGVVFRGHFSSVTTTGVLAQEAVGDHRNCALRFQLTEKPISLEEAGQRFDTVYLALRDLPPSELLTAAGPARVLDRHSCVYAGRRFAHIVLQYRGAAVSLLVTGAEEASQTAIPTEALAHLKSNGRIDAMSVVSFRTPRHMVFFVGDLQQADLLHLADAVAGSLWRQLAGA
jgi:hypothetical protein